MSRKVLDSNISDADVDTIMNEIIAQNPQLNAQIEKVHNENNAFLCKVLRLYPFEDKAYVKILNTGKGVFCRLSHEILGDGMSIDYLAMSGIARDTEQRGATLVTIHDDGEWDIEQVPFGNNSFTFFDDFKRMGQKE